MLTKPYAQLDDLAKFRFPQTEYDEARNQRDLGYIDMTDPFMIGLSRCGPMTYIAIRRKIPVNAAAVIAGPTDLRMERRRAEFVEGDDPESAAWAGPAGVPGRTSGPRRKPRPPIAGLQFPAPSLCGWRSIREFLVRRIW